MPAYAMVVVVDAPDENVAHDRVTRGVEVVDGPDALFVGEAWAVVPTIPAQRDVNMDGEQVDVDSTFDTTDCIHQRIDA